MQTQRRSTAAPGLGLALLLLFGGSAIGAQTSPAVVTELAKGKILVEIRFDGDYQRLEEFTKRFSAQLVRFVPPFLVLVTEEGRLPALRQEGYQVRFPDPDEVFEQVVRVEPASDAMVATVKNLGGHLVQREEAYTVFRVNRRELRMLEQQGIKVRLIREGELVARWVEIAAADERSVAAVVAAGVDIIEGRDGRVLGRAYDDQIESLAREGLKVTVVREPYRPPR